MVRARLLALLLAAAAVVLPPAQREAAAVPRPADPAAWTNAQLALQLVAGGVAMSSLSTATTWASAGLGGVVLLGSPPADLRSRLAALRATGPVELLVASDEEGGNVQRLAPVIYPLPSAEFMGLYRTPEQVRYRAADYARRMRALGVDVGLAPVADLKVPGYYIERRDRAFAQRPSTVGTYVTAWHRGMRPRHVLTVAKHWPGHGQATDTHTGGATTPPLSTLEDRDMVPFDIAMADGVPAVMVGHLQVPGLTEPDTPATLSPKALSYLRARLGPERLIVTDSLSMGAISSLGLSAPIAAVRALRAGADLVLVNADPLAVAARIRQSLDGGTYSRAAAVASVRRILHAKRWTVAPGVPHGLSPPAGATGVSVLPTLSAVDRNRVPGRDTMHFYVRTAGSATWNVSNAKAVTVDNATRARYAVEAGRLAPGSTYEWTAKTCNSRGYCGPASAVQRFTTSPAAPP
jgi:beta-N-acetylhexosaminidase